MRRNPPWSLALPLLVGLGASCSSEPPVCAPPELGGGASQPEHTDPHNVLIVLLDDIGPESVAAYDLHPDPPRTPVLDQLAEEGMRFDRAYAAPVCSPGRAQLLSGRYGRRYNVAHNLRYHEDLGSLPREETTVAEVVHASPLGRYATAAFGKWHLATATVADPLCHPNDQGFDHFDGTMANVGDAVEQEDGEPNDHNHWERLRNGQLEVVDDYNLSFTIDKAVAHLHTMPEPWLLYLPLHSAHGPNHVPPDALHSVDAEHGDPAPVLFAAMVEAADTEIGRLLDSIDPAVLARTTVVVVGDNGSWEKNVPDPWDVLGGKITMAEGGLRVPLIVRSPLVTLPGSHTDVPVHIVDLLPTVAELAQVDPADLDGPDGEPLQLDGRSLAPLLRGEEADWTRTTVYSELAGPPGPPPYAWSDQSAVMSRTHKALYHASADTWSLHRLGPSPADETGDLLGSSALTPLDVAAFGELQAEVDAMRATLTPPAYPGGFPP